MKPSVGVCTRPIEAKFQDLLNLEQRKPTSLSINLRTFAASTKSISISRGDSIASCTAELVISLNETR